MLCELVLSSELLIVILSTLDCTFVILNFFI